MTELNMICGNRAEDMKDAQYGNGAAGEMKVWLCKPHHVKADAYRRLAEKIKRYEKLLGLAVEA